MSERRENKQLTKDEVKKVLNKKQLATLIECQYFDWVLKFIRRPLFQEPVLVIYNTKYTLIGVLDQDGRINLDTEIMLRTSKTQDTQLKQSPQVQKVPEAASFKEKRTGMAPVPDNLAELLNQKQMRVLRQIEKFGWQLQFVRRPLFQDPIPFILSPKGDKFAILERDGRINVKHNLKIRREARVEHAEETTSVPAPAIKTAE